MIPPCLPRDAIIEFYEESVDKVLQKLVSLQNDYTAVPVRCKADYLERIRIYEDILADLYTALHCLK